MHLTYTFDGVFLPSFFLLLPPPPFVFFLLHHLFFFFSSYTFFFIFFVCSSNFFNLGGASQPSSPRALQDLRLCLSLRIITFVYSTPPLLSSRSTIPEEDLSRCELQSFEIETLFPTRNSWTFIPIVPRISELKQGLCVFRLCSAYWHSRRCRFLL